MRWAVIAQNAWESYFKKVNNKYFDPWTWYALSSGIQGKTREMEKALMRAAKLANLNYSKDPTLNRIRDMVRKKSIVNCPSILTLKDKLNF